MRTYADPTTCPSCGTPASAAERCGRCAVVLRGDDAREVLRLLTGVDRLLGSMRAEAATWQAAAPAPQTGPFVPSARFPAPGPPPPAVGAAPARRSWSVGAVLLALGALFLVVAAFVFVSVAWGSLGTGGRTAVLVLVTVLVGAVAAGVTWRRLRGSAEALWAVTAGLVTLDYWAARGYGLAGLDALDGAPATVVFGVLMLAGGVAVVLVSRTRLGSTVVVAELASVLGVACVAVGLAAAEGGSFWTALAGAVLAALVAVGARASGQRILVVGAAVVAGLEYLGLSLGQVVVLGAASDAGGLRWSDHVLERSAALAVVAVVVAVTASVLGSRRPVRRVSLDGVLSASVAVVVAQLAVPAYVGALADARVVDHSLALTAASSVVLLLLVLVSYPARGAWSRGLRVASAGAALPVAGLLAGWLALAAVAAADTVLPAWAGRATDPVVVDPADPLGPAWASLLLAAVLAVSLVLASLWRRGPITAEVRRVLVRAAVAVVLAMVLVQPLLHPVDAWVPVAVAVVAAVAALVGAVARRSRAGEWVVLAAVAAACGLALVDQALSAGTWVLGAALCGVLAWRAAGRWAVVAASTAGAALVLGAVPAGVDLVAGSDRVTHLLAAVGVLVVAALAQLVPHVVAAGRRTEVRVPVEAVTAAAALVVLVAVPGETLAWRALVWTVLGAGAALLGLLVVDRRRVGVAGSLVLGGAYVMRLLASDVGVVEAYTLPFAVALAVAGVLVLRRRPRTRSWAALGPALALALLPSLPAVLVDPTTLRGLLLGLGALAVLGAGVALRWQAPVVAGAAVTAVVALRHLGPYADAVPRWVVLAVAGLALLAVGITWESRVRQARAATLALRALR
ncbi:MAG: hypothetical protein Q7T56_01500 [Nocardioidaceae bacterium]|nr:hypothetical protein [Nocardioidaceae bacterium]